MLEEFIKASETKAEILYKRASSNQVKCVLLLSRSKNTLPVLAVFPAGRRISIGKAEKKAKCSGLRQAGEGETHRITGYEHGFLPPVAIYGVRVFVDKSVLSMPVAYVLVGEKKTLKIEPGEILELNEGAVECDILEKQV